MTATAGRAHDREVGYVYVDELNRLQKIEIAARELYALSKPPMRGECWYEVRPSEMEALAKALAEK